MAEDGVYQYDRTGITEDEVTAEGKTGKACFPSFFLSFRNDWDDGNDRHGIPCSGRRKASPDRTAVVAVPVLAAAGLVCIGIGIKRRKEVENETE